MNVGFINDRNVEISKLPTVLKFGNRGLQPTLPTSTLG